MNGSSVEKCNIGIDFELFDSGILKVHFGLHDRNVV